MRLFGTTDAPNLDPFVKPADSMHISMAAAYIPSETAGISRLPGM
jgi:hypothetical protein